MKPVFPHCVAPDAGSHQVDIRSRRRSVSIAGGAGSRSPRASAADQRSAPRQANPTDVHGRRQVGVRLDLLAVSERPRRPRRRTTGNRRALASRGFSILLALEVERLARSPCPTSGNPETDPRDEHCQSVVGRATNPRRTAQAWDRDRRVDLSKYLLRHPWATKSGVGTFLNHAPDIAAMEVLQSARKNLGRHFCQHDCHNHVPAFPVGDGTGEAARGLT